MKWGGEVGQAVHVSVLHFAWVGGNRPPCRLGLTNTLKSSEEAQGHSPGSLELCPEQPKWAIPVTWGLERELLTPRPTGVPPCPSSEPLCPLWDWVASHTPVPSNRSICITAVQWSGCVAPVGEGRGGSET